MTLPDAKGKRTEKPLTEKPIKGDGSKEILLGTFDKNSTEKIRIKLKTWKHKEYIEIRTWYTVNGKDFLPGKKGILLSAEILPALLESLQEAGKILKEGDGKEGQ